MNHSTDGLSVSKGYMDSCSQVNLCFRSETAHCIIWSCITWGLIILFLDLFFSWCFLCRLFSRCTVAFKENHRPQELRVPHIEAGRVPGVPSGGEDGTPQSLLLIIRTVPVVRHNDALSEISMLTCLQIAQNTMYILRLMGMILIFNENPSSYC